MVWPEVYVESGKCADNGRNELRRTSLKQMDGLVKDEAVLITDTVCNAYIRQISDYCRSRSVHQIECAGVIRFGEVILLGKSREG